MKKKFVTLALTALTLGTFAQTAKTIKLNEPSTSRGLTVMQALKVRASASMFDTSSISLQNISDLLWAANGINRPDNGKRTAPSAMNSQDIDVYLFMKGGAYLYNAKEHALSLVAEGDSRSLFKGRPGSGEPPIVCLLVSDMSRFKNGDNDLRKIWAAEDAGIVSQNISLFCASVKLGTRPRASMDVVKIKDLLKLSDQQVPMLNHPVANITK